MALFLDITIFFFGLIFLILTHILEGKEGVEIITSLFFSLYVIVLAWRNTRHRLVFLFLLFVLAYPAVFILSKYMDLPYHYLTYYQDPYLESLLFSYGIIFFSLFFLGVRYKENQEYLSVNIFSPSLFWISFSISLFLLFLGTALAWPPQVSDYSVDSRSSSLFEYAVIPAVLSMLLAKKRSNIIGLYLLFAIGIILPLLFARRGVSIIFFIMLFYCITRNIKSPFSIIVIMIFAFLGYRLFALLRADIGFTLASLVGVHGADVLSNHQGGVIVASVTYLGLVHDEVWDMIFRAKSALGLMFVPYIPSALNPFREVFLHLEALKITVIPGSGGFPFVYLSIWGGVIYVMIGALVMRWILFNRSSNPHLVMLRAVMLVSFPRWYAYSLPVGFKYAVLALIFSFFLLYFGKRK